MGIGFQEIIVILLMGSPILIGVIVLGWQKKIKVKHNESGVQKNCFVGYSWTYLIFGFFVPIFRGEISIGVFHLILSLVTFGIFQLIMPFLYNKQYSIRLLNNSWSLNDSEEKNAVARQKIGIAVG
jgi:hypothetical protein|tara:strand:+ start:171 stop:548 length:378 start_codon:yes stop_codon:yes gene_type:complete